MTTTSIKAVIFDYGEVLNASDSPAAEKERRARLARRLQLPTEELWSYLFEGDTANKWMIGLLNWDEFWAAVLAPKGIDEPEEVAAFAEAVFAGTNRLNSDMVSLLFELKGKVKLAIISNATWTEAELHSKLYEEFGLPEGLFDVIITSNGAGFAKPEAAIFLHGLSRLGVKPEETVFTDDLPNFTAAAARLGIHSHTFKSPAAFREYLIGLGVLL